MRARVRGRLYGYDSGAENVIADGAVGVMDVQEIELDNEASCLSVARTFVADYLEELGVSEGDAFEILLALSEAVANAHRHGRRGYRGRIRLGCGADEGVLRFVVKDDGHGFDYSPGMKEMPDPLQPGGRGLSLMNQLMDHLDVRTGPQGTMVVLERRASVNLDRGQRPDGGRSSTGTRTSVGSFS